MAASATKVILIFLATIAITVPCLEANIAEYDEYLVKKAKGARRKALQAYEPNPYNVTSDLNLKVHVHLEGLNSTRRDLGDKLKKYKGPCTATNPIDSCWRCRLDWATDRKRLARCAQGFGRKTTGGLDGPFYVVTDDSDNDVENPVPGTLRHAAIQDGPLWIIFDRSMTIELKQELIVTSDKTVDGRGANVQIKGGGSFMIQYVSNVIIHNIRIKKIKSLSGGMIRDCVDHIGIRTRSDGDAISIFGSSNVWIDHVSMTECEDGLVDAVQGSTGITISNCHMTDHDHVMLFGASESYSGDKIMQVTVAFNHFGKKLRQRMPRCRYGFVHVVNNDYTHWEMYAIGGSSGPTILSQGNRFIAPDNQAAKVITHRDYAPKEVWSTWKWTSEKDLLMNGAEFIESGGPMGELHYDEDTLIKPKDGSAVTLITRFAGRLSCKKGKPC